MWRMFGGASAFNQPIGGWSVDKVTDMCAMFFGASAFNQPLGDWRLGSNCYTQDMFAGTDFQNSRPVESCCAISYIRPRPPFADRFVTSSRKFMT